MFELADAWVGALPDGEGCGGEAFAEGVGEDGTDVVLRGALREELDEDEVVVAVGDDAGEVVGLGEDEAVGVGGLGDGGEVAAELESGVDAGAEVGEVLMAREAGCAGDEASGDLRGGGVERGAERDLAGVGEGDEGAGVWGELIGFEIGFVDPEVACAETVGGAAGDAECGHEFKCRRMVTSPHS